MDNEQYGEVTDNEIITVDFTKEGEKRRKTNLIARLVYSAVSLLAGLIFIFARDSIFDLLGYIAGGMLLITGAGAIISFLASKSARRLGALIGGILQAVLGIFCLVKPKMVADLAVYVFALIIFISGVVMIYFAVGDKNIGFVKWKPILVFGIILALLGAAMLLFVRQSQAVIAVITGVSFVITAVFNLVALLLR